MNKATQFLSKLSDTSDTRYLFWKYLLILSFLLISILTVNAQESQNEILANYESGAYTVYKLNDKKKFEQVKKQWPIEITKGAQGIESVLVKRSGILDELFKPDVPGYPAYFGYQTYRLTFLKNYVVYYEWNGKQEAKAKYVFVKSGKGFSKDLPTTNREIEQYATATFTNQSGARADQKALKAELAEAERKANSLEGKPVQKIDIQLVNQPSKVGHFSEAIQYGVVATLKDGSQLKSPNLGGQIPWSDFKLDHKGCSNTVDEVRVDEDATSLTDDAITLRVQSVYHSTLKASRSIHTTNDVSIRVNQNGFWGNERHKHMTVFQGVDGQHAGNGDNLIIKIATVPHQQTGTPLNKIEVFNVTKNKTIARYKLTPSTELIINTKGGQGMNGWKGRSSENTGGNGGNGGNGGDVTIIKDPSVTNYNITINNQGGKGGLGGPPYYANGTKGNQGRAGLSGNTITQTQTLSLNF